MQAVTTSLGYLWSGQGAPTQDRSSSDRNQSRQLQQNSNAHTEGQSDSSGAAMSGAVDSSGGVSGSGSRHQQYLSSPTRPPPRQTSPSYSNSAIGGSSSSTTSSPSASNHIGSSSGQQAFGVDYSPVSSQWGAIGSSAAASNSSEDFFFQRDPLLLPRRNHTVGAGTSTSNRRRLGSHFQFPSQGPTSPGQNSLSAITGGQDVDEDDWESMIKSRDKLVPDEDDGDETITRAQGERRSPAVTSAWKPDSSLFPTSHHRFSSQPSSAQAASPYYSAESHSPVSSNEARSNIGHHRSESAHVRSLEHGPFASASTVNSHNSRYSNVDVGMIRRHQSLNHATGRATANRLQASTRRNNDQQRSPVDFFDHPSALHSISPGVVPMMSGRATPESAAQSQSGAMPSASLMDAHARLSRMTLQPSQSIREDSLDSNATAQDNDGRRRLPSLITNREALEKSAAFSLQGKNNYTGPVSAAPYVPPIGHGHHRRTSASSNAVQPKGDSTGLERPNNPSLLQGSFSALPANNANSTWGMHGLSASGKVGQQATELPRDEASLPKPPHLATMDNTALNIAMLQQRLLQNTAQYPLSAVQQLQQQQAIQNGMQSTGAMFYAPGGQSGPLDMRQQNAQPMANIYSTMNGEGATSAAFRGYPAAAPLLGQSLAPQPVPAPSISPALASLIAARGYNPTPMQFDLNPSRARFFVIKSFTEDDVQRSLKYEIWASTDKGNQRLDKAYKECQDEGGIPLYLFFSVNASGHFCGMAQMMTVLDYNSSSNVWVQEGKWKGTFKVKWIYVKDVPNVKLRHICLTNTPERKPVTQSRDTQELPTDGGKEVLRIMAEYQSKTTLLQDWLFYEQQALQQQQRKENGEALLLPTDGLASTAS